MTELWFGQNLMVLPGVRVENTDANATSRYLESKKGDVVQPTPSDLNYTDVFPSLHTRYKLPKDINIRASLSKGIARPSFRESIGFNDYTSDDLLLQTGNPDLKPERATNFDILLEHYATNMASHMSIGFFYKNIRDVVEEVEDSYLPEDNKTVNGFWVTDVETWRNVGTGIAQGIELSVQRQLDFLNLPNIGVLANWTHQLDTYLESADGERRALEDVPDDIVNLALSVELPKAGFSSRLSFQHRSISLLERSDNHEEWLKAENNLDLNLRQRITNSVSFIFNARNLLGTELTRQYLNLRSDIGSNPLWNTSRITHRGTEIYAGFQFNL
jgi:TonB-dependent receptor